MIEDKPDEKLSSMTIGEALDKIGEGGQDSLALLRMIEGNTKPSVVGKAMKNAMPAKEAKSGPTPGTPAPIVKVDVVAPPPTVISQAATSKPSVVGKAMKNAMPAKEALSVPRPRNTGGRFASSSPTERIQPALNRPTEKPFDNPAQGKTLMEILKGGAKSTWHEKKGDVKDIAGRAALGPLWDVSQQIKETFQSTKEKSAQGTTGELRTWGSNKFSKKPEGGKQDVKAHATHDIAQAKHDKIEATSDKAEAKHDQLQEKADKAKLVVKTGTAVSAAQMSSGGSGSGLNLSDAPFRRGKRRLKDALKRGPGGKISMSPKAGGPGMSGRAGSMVSRGGGVIARGASSAMGGLAKLAGPLMSGISLPLVAAAGAAAFGIQQMTMAMTTGESDINNWFKKITGLDAGKETQGDRDRAAKGDQARLDELNRGRAAQGLSEVDSSGRYATKGNVAFANGNTTTVKNADGSLTEQKGTRAARNNNAGNMEYGEAAKALGATGSDGRFAVFPDKATGDKAKEKMFFEGKNYKDKTLSEATARWAPSSENDTQKYTDVLTKAGGGENKKMSEYTPEQRKSIMSAMEKHEGNKLTSTKTIPASEADAYLASKGKGGTTAVATAAPYSAPGTPEYAAMQAKFIADQQPTSQGANAPGAKKKKGKSKDVQTEVAPAEEVKSGAPATVLQAATVAKKEEIPSTEEIKPEAITEGKQARTSPISMGRKAKASPAQAATPTTATMPVGSSAEPIVMALTETTPVQATAPQAPVTPTQQALSPPPQATSVNAPAMSYDEQKSAREGIQSDYWAKEQGRRAQSGEIFKQVKEQQAGMTAEKEAKLSDIETRRKDVEAKYDAGGLNDEEAGKQQMALDSEGEQVKKEHLSKMGNSMSVFNGVDRQSGQLLVEKEANEKALDARIAGTTPAETATATVSGSAQMPVQTGQTATVPVLSKREQEVQKIAAEQQSKPTYQDKADAIETKRVDAVTSISADATLSDEEKKQKKAEARAASSKETQALKEEDAVNNENINTRLATADKADSEAKAAPAAIASPAESATLTTEGQATAATATATPAEGTATVGAVGTGAPVPAAASVVAFAPAIDATTAQRSLSDAVNSGNKENAASMATAKASKADKDTKLQDITDREAAANSDLESKGLNDADYEKSYGENRSKFQAERETLNKPEVAVAAATSADGAASPAVQGAAEGKPSGQGAATVAVAQTQGQPEYKRPPEPKPIQPEPPKIQGMDQLVAATQQNQPQPGNQQDKGNDKTASAAIPNIPTEFSDVQLTLMAYDRT
jgi:hypothetical protein